MKDNQPTEQRRFAQAYLRSFDPALAAREVGCQDGVKLLASPLVRREIELQRAQWDVGRADVLRHLARVAFGRCNDCVRLVLEEGADLDALDLTMLFELRRSDKGGVEVRLVDRVKALQTLLEAQAGQTDCAEAFFAAAEDVPET